MEIELLKDGDPFFKTKEEYNIFYDSFVLEVRDEMLAQARSRKLSELESRDHVVD
mgnify:FL=1